MSRALFGYGEFRISCFGQLRTRREVNGLAREALALHILAGGRHAERGDGFHGRVEGKEGAAIQRRLEKTKDMTLERT